MRLIHLPKTSAISGSSLPEAAKPPKLGLVVVDMQEDVRYALTYSKGPLSVGLSRVIKLLEKAKELEIPIIFVTLFNPVTPPPTVLPELRLVAPDSPTIRKRETDAFRSKEFSSTISQFGLDTLVLAGFNRSVCVLDTAKSALNLGMLVLTSMDVLFGDLDDGNSIYFTEQERHDMFSFYFQRTNYHHTVGSLMAAMQQLRNEGLNAGWYGI